MNQKLPTPQLFLQPHGIVRQEWRLAANPIGALVLLSGHVTAEDGETYLPSLVEYAIDEPLPRTLIIGRDLLLEVVRPAVLSHRTRRCLLLSGADGTARELWLYFEPEGVWAIAKDPAWIETVR